jgi:hypothetical protein
MSIKTCQLCGKPLGRKGDGDFCSREHRNQFRLRRGMDRLEEANKVASLMRRRENPRQIPAAQLAVEGATQPRGATVPAAFPVRQPEPRFASLKPLLARTRVTTTGETFANPQSELSRRSSAGAKRLVTPAALPVVSKKESDLSGLKEIAKPEAGVARAGLSSIPRHLPARKGEQRNCGAALRMSRKAAFPARQFEIEQSTAACLERARRPQHLIVTASAASAGENRIHGRREFNKRKPALRGWHRSLSASSGLPGPRVQPGTAPEIQNIPSLSRDCRIARAEGTLSFPQFRAGAPVAGTRPAGAARLVPSAYDSISPSDSRGCPVNWEPAGSVSPPPLRAGVRAGMAKPANPVPFAAACDAARGHRPAEVRFTPTDSAFEGPPMDLQGSFAAPSNGSGRSGAEAIEEHFDAGLEQWTGDLVDWKLDAAGARPAGLALLKPTIALGDYEFEFFTRIESRAVTFAFRAVNVSNYFKVTIAMVESGRYELRRCAVIGGMEEAPAVAPLPGVLRPGAAFTVKVSAWQNDFSIWLDGELAARWTDGRLPTGGIGFMAPRDDRARVYWVRLSQLEGPNSQAATHRMVRSIQ